MNEDLHYRKSTLISSRGMDAPQWELTQLPKPFINFEPAITRSTTCQKTKSLVRTSFPFLDYFPLPLERVGRLWECDSPSS